jgi:hypothetical protein
MVFGANPGEAGDPLKVIFVCKSADCSESFESKITTTLGCQDVLSAGRTKAGEGADLIVKYGPDIAERSTAPLIKYADTYAVEMLHETSEVDGPACIKLDKYDSGTRTVLAALFRTDPSGALTDSSAACLDLMKGGLPEGAGWCVSVRVPGLPMR